MIKDPHAKIVQKKSWNKYHSLKIISPATSAGAKPGQFVMVRVSPHTVPLLRRPLSIHNAETGHIELFFQEAGCGTEILGQKDEGTQLDIIGPLGKGFGIKNSMTGKQAAVLGGGRGIAPLFFLTKELTAAGASVKVFYGGKSKDDLPLKERFEKAGFDVRVSTDDGTLGYKGLVTDLFIEELKTCRPDTLYACGPDSMLQKLTLMSREHNIPAELSLESLMGCGFGACWGCVKHIRRAGTVEWLKICEEGPVFQAEEIVWNEEDNG